MTVTLRDGSRIVIRPIEPEDRDALADGFRRLSPESRYRRFFSPVNELREQDLDYLTQVDHHRHEALVAVDAASGEGAGVARFVQTEPGVAEPAIVVADDWQRRGVATVLLHALVDRAREEGVERFHAPILATNTDAIHLFERLGQTTRRSAGHEVELDVALPAGPGAGPLTRLLRLFATQVAIPARTVLDLLRPHRPGAPGDYRRNAIVVGQDGSGHAAEAVAAAARLAAVSGAAVHVVGAHRLLLPDRDEVTEAVQGTARALREQGLQVQEHLRRGDPALVLSDVADEEAARLLVVGAGERSGAARRLLGSVADNLVDRSPCDVLIVRPREEPTE